MWLHMTNYKDGSSAGFLLISFQILNQRDAESNPVGLGREEPNKDPYLEEPPEGRDVVAAFAGNLGLGSLDLTPGWVKDIRADVARFCKIVGICCIAFLVIGAIVGASVLL